MKKYFFIILLLTCPFNLLFASAKADAQIQTECTVALNEIMPNPAGTDTGKEWIEIYNCEEGPVDLNGWYLKDKSGGKHTLDGLTIDSLGHLLIYPTLSLNQTDEEISLFDNEQQLIDFFSYPTSKEDTSYARDTDGRGEWTDQLKPTPGSENIKLEAISIKSFKEDEEGAGLQLIEGTITSSPGQIYSNRMYVQDSTGGILVSLPAELLEVQDFEIGEQVKLCGTYSTYYKEQQFKVAEPECVEKIGTQKVTVYNYIPEKTYNDFVGQLVQTSGEITKISGTTFWIQHNNGVEVKISLTENITDIDKHKGDKASIAGILTVYGESSDGTPNIRLIPRGNSDIQITPTTNEVEPKVATSKNEKTIIKKSSETKSVQQSPSSIKKVTLSQPKITKLENFKPEQAVEIKQKEKSKIYQSISAGGLFTSISSIFLLFLKKS